MRFRHQRLFGIAIATCLAAPAAQADTIVMAADTWCPYNCAPNSDRPGYVVELAKTVFAAAGHTVRYKQTAWNRALVQTAKGKVDAAIGVSTEPETKKMVLPEEPIGYLETSMVTSADSDWRYTGGESLKGKKIGVHADYGYPAAIEAYMKNNPNNVFPASGGDALETNLKLVARGRIDVFPVDKSVANYLSQKLGIADQIRVAGQASQALPLYIGFSKKTENAKKYARIWTEGVRKLRKNGKLSAILEPYNVSDWKRN